MEESSSGIVVTGANGQIGCALLRELAARNRSDVRALVRSERARKTIEELFSGSGSGSGSVSGPAPEIQIVDYLSPTEMEAALQGMHTVVHLVGIIKETPEARYVEAHEQTCHSLALAASRAGTRRIVYLSILGAAPQSENICLASKGRAESLLLDDRVPATVLRVPMVLGGDDPASASLRRQARAQKLRLVDGGRTLQQPIDVRDVVNAILASEHAQPGRDLALDAGGPESLTHRELVLRAARLWNNEPKIRSLPMALARLGIRIMGLLMRRPPVTLPMFEILQHDDKTDPELFTKPLGIELHPLAETLKDFVGPESEAQTPSPHPTPGKPGTPASA